jgi:hypothetical protein
MAIYLIPLASEDLFDYLFNVIQFMIVVVSTQLAYKLLAGKSFSFQRVIKHVMKGIDKYIKEYYPNSARKEVKNDAKNTGDFLARELLVPHIVMTTEYNKRHWKKED